MQLFGGINYYIFTVKHLFYYFCGIMWPSYRPHYASCPSVFPSVRLSVCPYRLVTRRQKKRRKIKIGADVPLQGTSKAVITIAIRLRHDYDPTTTYRARLLPLDVIRREQKMNM